MIYNYVCFFFIYAFFGWCMEVCYAAVEEGKFVNKGFLNGPVCPIYGVGMILVVLVLTPLKENLLILFLGSILLTSTLEFLTGFVLEKIFHEKWWDYSNKPFNIKGYICLEFSLLWGLACLLVMSIFHPLISVSVNLMPVVVGWTCIGIFGITILTDAIVTVCTMFNINRDVRKLEIITERLKTFSDGFGEKLSEGTIGVTEKIQEASEYGQQKIQEASVYGQQKKNELSELLREKEMLLKKHVNSLKRLQSAFPDLKFIKRIKK